MWFLRPSCQSRAKLHLAKVIELEVKSKGRWKKTELESFLLPFADRARSLGVSKNLSRYLHDLRDKCAHIRTGQDAFGVTHLDNKQAVEVEKCLPLLGDIAIAGRVKAIRLRFDRTRASVILLSKVGFE